MSHDKLHFLIELMQVKLERKKEDTYQLHSSQTKFAFTSCYKKATYSD